MGNEKICGNGLVQEHGKAGIGISNFSGLISLLSCIPEFRETWLICALNLIEMYEQDSFEMCIAKIKLATIAIEVKVEDLYKAIDEYRNMVLQT